MAKTLCSLGMKCWSNTLRQRRPYALILKEVCDMDLLNQRWVYDKLLNVITHPSLNFNGGLTKPPLTFGYGWVIISHKRCDYLYVPSVNLCQWKGPQEIKILFFTDKSGTVFKAWISNYIPCEMWLLMHALISVNLCWWRGHRRTK